MISKFKEVHGDRYDYSKIVYKNIKTKISIRCIKHNVIFEQTPHAHIENKSEPCFLCYTEKLIQTFRKIHGNKYDYSLVKPKLSKDKIKIICPIHGEFEQSLEGHKKGRGCTKCTIRDPNTIICKFKEVHRDKYDYSKVIYKNVDTPIIILCPKHGEFKQNPSHHLSGSGCIKCTIRDPNTIISKFKEVHGDKYDYSKVNYINTGEKVIIICKKHGEFEQRPSTHLKGSGCMKCTLHDKYDLIQKFKAIHGNKYNYSLLTDNITKRIKIICKKHGEFEQKYDNHLRGNGCPICSKERTFKEIYEDKYTILYYISINDNTFKVGLTTTSVINRYNKELFKGVSIKILREVPFTNGYEAFKLEQQILKESINKGTVLKEECELVTGYTEVRKNDFIHIFDKITNYRSKICKY